MTNTYMFDNVLTLASHLKFKNKDISPLRLQKSLYFLFAFYSQTFGSLHVESVEEGIFEGSEDDSYPEYLFEDDFEAWKFGPVLRSVYVNNKHNAIPSQEWEPNDYKEIQVSKMIDEALEAINKLGDFQLVERTHEDSAWKNAIKPTGEPGIIKKEDIINDYK